MNRATPPAHCCLGGFHFSVPDCFAFLRPRRDARGQAHTSQKPFRLSLLDDALRAAAARRCVLARRASVVTWHLLPLAIRVLADWLKCGGPTHGVANARRLRLALQHLGPAFVKLGQALAAREDVLSAEVAAELLQLCDQVPAFPTEYARQLLADELGSRAPVVPDVPIAAASLGQVYLVNVAGCDYALKVQRPGLAEALATDVVILKKLASVIRCIFRRVSVASIDMVRVTHTWAETLWKELDYVREARMMEELGGAICPRVPGLVVPHVCWELSATRVLATEWIRGHKVTERPDTVRESHIQIGVEAFASMILDVGLVHADPHPGNMIITIPDGNVCLLDFGMVIEIPPSHRSAWAACVVNLVRGKHAATLESLVEIGFFPADCPRDVILPVMSRIWTELVACGSSTQKRKTMIRDLYGEILTLVRRFDFNLPDYYVALVRALLTLEGMALKADCDFDIFRAAFPVALRTLTSSTVSSSEKRAIAVSVAAAGVRGFCNRLATEVSNRLCQKRQTLALLGVLTLGTAAAVQAVIG